MVNRYFLAFVALFGIISCEEFTLIGTDESSVGKFLQSGKENGSKIEHMFLIGGNLTLDWQVLRHFKTLILFHVSSTNPDEPFIIDENAFRNCSRLRSIFLDKVSFVKDRLLNLDYLPELTVLEITGLQGDVKVSKSLLNLPALTTFVYQTANKNVSWPEDAFENMKNLTALSIDGGPMRNLPQSLLRLEKLQNLKVSYSKVETVQADQLANLSGSLTALDLSYNQLTNITLPFIPTVTFLDLRGNNLSVIPEQMLNSTPALINLWLSDNRLESLGDSSLDALTELQLLDLTGNQLEEFDLSRIHRRPERLSFLLLGRNKINRLRLPRFVGSVYVYNNQLERIDRSQFTSGSVFEELDLRNNPIAVIENSAFSNISLPRSLEFSQTDMQTFSMSCLDGMLNVEEVVVSNNPRLTTVAKGTLKTIRLPDSFRVIKFVENSNLSFSDSHNQLRKLGGKRFEYVVGGAQTCECSFKSVVEGPKAFVVRDTQYYVGICVNLNQLSVSSFLTDYEKYCKNDTSEVAAPQI